MKSKVHQAINSMSLNLKQLFMRGSTSVPRFSRRYPENAEEKDKILKEFNLTVEDVDSYGGEDMGDEYWRVLKFIDNETKESVLVQFDGYYTSYDGSTYSSWFFVKAEQVVVTQYVKTND
jgi:hypothetical protein